MGKAKNKICSECGKLIEPVKGDRKRAPQATMHLSCAEEKERKQSLKIMNKLRLPDRKNKTLQKVGKYGLDDEIAEKTIEKISEDLEKKPKEDSYLSYIESIVPNRIKNVFGKKDFNEILDRKIEEIVNKKVEEKFQELKEEIKKSNHLKLFGY